MQAHVEMIRQSYDTLSVCSVSGYSGHTLGKLGLQLEVDRIDSSKGYIEGNMRLLAAPLNRAKGDHPNIPPGSIRRLNERVERLARSRLDQQT